MPLQQIVVAILVLFHALHSRKKNTRSCKAPPRKRSLTLQSSLGPTRTYASKPSRGWPHSAISFCYRARTKDGSDWVVYRVKFANLDHHDRYVLRTIDETNQVQDQRNFKTLSTKVWCGKNCAFELHAPSVSQSLYVEQFGKTCESSGLMIWDGRLLLFGPQSIALCKIAQVGAERSVETTSCFREQAQCLLLERPRANN